VPVSFVDVTGVQLGWQYCEALSDGRTYHQPAEPVVQATVDLVQSKVGLGKCGARRDERPQRDARGAAKVHGEGRHIKPSRAKGRLRARHVERGGDQNDARRSRLAGVSVDHGIGGEMLAHCARTSSSVLDARPTTMMSLSGTPNESARSRSTAPTVSSSGRSADHPPVNMIRGALHARAE